MNTINKLLCLLMLAVFTTASLYAQDSRAYNYQTDKSGNLKKDANGNAIDFSAVTSLLSGNTANQNTQVVDMPFNVVFLGKVYKSFMVGTSGYLVLGNTDRKINKIYGYGHSPQPCFGGRVGYLYAQRCCNHSRAGE
jgi:hypothetical protein